MAKAAILGCGMIAGRYEDFASPRTYSHAKAYAENDAFEQLALYDRNSDNARLLASKTPAVLFETPSELLSSFQPDVVSICTPDDDHAASIEMLMTSDQAPALVFCEKPVCRTRTEFERIWRLERTGRSRVMVNHSRRFDPAHQALKRRIAGGEFGALVQAHVTYYGGWCHLGVHIVDILQFLFDEKFVPRDVAYCCASRYPDDPTLDVSGTLGRASVRMSGFPESYFQIVDIALLLERGMIRNSDFGQQIEVYRKTVNAEKENVLVRDDAASGPGMIGTMSNAIAVAARYINERDPRVIEPYGLAQAGITMDTLWQGDDLLAAQT